MLLNVYSMGDEVFYETANPPWLLEGVLDSTATYAWQKQETSKGSRALAGTAYGGWGFHSWRIAGFDYTYSATEANAMVADGSVTNNPVFNRGYEPMLATNATPDEVMCALAKYVPAVSSAVGGTRVWNTLGMAIDLNEDSDLGVRRPNGWGRLHATFGESWFHSDMKDMAFFYVYQLYNDLITKGCLK